VDLGSLGSPPREGKGEAERGSEKAKDGDRRLKNQESLQEKKKTKICNFREKPSVQAFGSRGVQLYRRAISSAGKRGGVGKKLSEKEAVLQMKNQGAVELSAADAQT